MTEELAALYIRLYFDEDVSADIVDNLRTRGFDVESARDAALLSRDDEEQMAYAVSQRRAVVTHNRSDFERQSGKYEEAGLQHHGIVIAKRRRRDEEVVARLLELMDTITAEEMANQLRYI